MMNNFELPELERLDQKALLVWLSDNQPTRDQPTRDQPTRDQPTRDQRSAILIRVAYDVLTQDFCAECDEFGGLINWGATVDKATQKLLEDWKRHYRHFLNEAAAR